MQTGQPSRTALAAAAMRAAHQTLDGGRIFNDPIAHAVLGPEADAMISAVAADPAQRQMSVFMAARSRFAEDSLDKAVARGVRQVVILGAGLDTFSCATRMRDWVCECSRSIIPRRKHGSAIVWDRPIWQYRRR